MTTDSGTSKPIWSDSANIPTFDALQGDLDTDVCIVGAGIAGITTAYLLAREGKRVVVLDDGPVAGGETGRTTAHLVCALDDYYDKIEKMHGPEGARIAAESHMAAIDLIEKIVRDEGIECEFERVDGYWFTLDGKGQDLDDEAEAARRAGISGVERLSEIPGLPFPVKAALRFPNQAQFHPLKYIAGLTTAIVRDGGQIFSGTHVESVAEETKPRVKTSDGHTVTANAIVVATNSPVNAWVKIHTKQAAYRTYVVGVRIPKGAVPRGLYWDTLDPYHYVRLTSHDDTDDILIVGGEDHKTGQAEDEARCLDHLEHWARTRFPMAKDLMYQWSGQVLEPVDYMAFIGRSPGDESIYMATGDSGNGMTHGTIAGMLITDLIAGRDNEWTRLYDPERKSLKAAPAFLRENLNVAVQYAHHATPGEIGSPDELQVEEGAVMRQGTKMIAVYKDAAGDVHMRSAVCPHLYCVVDWNTAEKTWDCPCHGSRFDSYGRVINGPALSDLAELSADVAGTVATAAARDAGTRAAPADDESRAT